MNGWGYGLNISVPTFAIRSKHWSVPVACESDLSGLPIASEALEEIGRIDWSFGGYIGLRSAAPN